MKPSIAHRIRDNIKVQIIELGKNKNLKYQSANNNLNRQNKMV
jgi:hypothetical protein